MNVDAELHGQRPEASIHSLSLMQDFVLKVRKTRFLSVLSRLLSVPWMATTAVFLHTDKQEAEKHLRCKAH